MGYLILVLICFAVIIFLLKVKNFDSLLHRFIYVVVCAVVIVLAIVFIQPDEYIKYNSEPNIGTQNKQNTNSDNISQIQYLAIKMKTEGFSEEQIVESFYHEYRAKLSVASELEKANFSLETIKKFFTNYKNSGILKNRKLTIQEYLRYLVEQDIKRFSKFSNEDRIKIREMEKNKKSIKFIIDIYPNYKPNDEMKAIELGRTGKSLREVKKVFQNYEPKK